MNTKKTELAWAAGFIDGEGTISIKRFHRARKGGRYIYYQPFVSLSQAVVGGHEQGVLKMHQMFGGSISDYKDKRDSTRYATKQWSAVSNDALKCIKSIYPFLVIKRKNADVLFKFDKTKMKLKGGSGKIKMTQNEMNKRENMFYESRLLNQKGKLHLQRLNEKTE